MIDSHKSGVVSKRREWDSRNPLGEVGLKSIAKEPLSHPTKLKQQQMQLLDRVNNARQLVSVSQQTLKAESIKGWESDFLVTRNDYSMDRPLAPLKEKPKFNPNSSFTMAGLSFSVEQKGETTEGLAELEVLKSILNREGYLSRLFNVTQKMGKHFDAEVADMIDFIRTATIDTIEKIVLWRNSKRQHDAVFTWNGVNYLLKIPSDLDYLSGFIAVKRWMGFDLHRNPFCVPFPMELGLHMLSDQVLDPKHNNEGGNDMTEGFFIGGIREKRKKGEVRVSVSAGSKMSPYGIPEGTKGSIKGPKEHTGHQAASFVLNAEMVKIRQAEYVVLLEEQAHGKLTRDELGKVVPLPDPQQSHGQAHTHRMKNDHNLHTSTEFSKSTNFAQRGQNHCIKMSDTALPRNNRMGRGRLTPLDPTGTSRSIPNISTGSALVNGALVSGTARLSKKRTMADRLQVLNELRFEIQKKRHILADERDKKTRNRSLGASFGTVSYHNRTPPHSSNTSIASEEVEDPDDVDDVNVSSQALDELPSKANNGLSSPGNHNNLNKGRNVLFDLAEAEAEAEALSMAVSEVVGEGSGAGKTEEGYRAEARNETIPLAFLTPSADEEELRVREKEVELEIANLERAIGALSERPVSVSASISFVGEVRESDNVSDASSKSATSKSTNESKFAKKGMIIEIYKFF